MAGKKFSEFSTGATTDNTFIVGYDTTADTNNQYTLAQLATGLSPLIPTIYSADGTITTGRKALLAGTLQFRNSGDSSDIFKLNTDGTFALGLGATTTVANQVAIGNGVTASGSFDVAIGYASTASAGGGMAIGRSASSNANGIALGFTAGSASGGLAIGYASKNYVSSAPGETYGIALGFSCTTGAKSVGIGDNIDISSATNAIAIGSKASSTGNNSITFNSNGTAVSASTANAFGVYMSSNTTPDLEVVGGGESTLRTSLKITGQAYTELHTVTSAASITPDWNNSNVQTFELTSASTTIVNPSNIKPGATYILILKQDSTGGRTVSFGTQYNFPADTAPTLTTTANKADVITLVAYSSTVLMCTSVLDFTTT